MKNHLDVREKLNRHKGNILICPHVAVWAWNYTRECLVHEVGGSRGLMFPVVEAQLFVQLNRTLSFLQPRIRRI